MKEERMAILRMLENGVISAEEAERLLNILNENKDKEGSCAFAKAGSAIESIVENVGKKAGEVAKVVGEKAEQAKPEIKKAAKTVAEKVSEAAETIKGDINRRRAEKGETNQSDFVYEGEAEETEDTSEKKTFDDTIDKATGPIDEGSVSENEEIESSGFSQEEEKNIDEEFNEEDDDRDYEAEYYQMMKETNGGDIFGDVYRAIDNLNEIDKFRGAPTDNTEDEKTNNE